MTKMRGLLRNLMWTTALVPICAFSNANAQQAQGPDPSSILPEVVVTATRQSQVLSRVPVSVSAYTRENLDRQGVAQIDDVARLTPGLTFTRNTAGNGNQNNIAIRGIVSTNGFATTGVYIDDTPIAVRQIFPAFNGYPRVFDLERVEVLRGPQGTLFGAGAQGGVVRFITPQPSLSSYSVYARAEGSRISGGDSSFEAGAAIGGPIVEDKLGFRVSASYRRDGGWVDRVDFAAGTNDLEEKNANWSDHEVYRAALTWAPTERLTITPTFYYQKSFTNDTSVSWEQLSNPATGRFVNGNPLQTPGTDWFSLPDIGVKYDFGPVILESNSSLFTRKARTLYDYTSLIAGIFAGDPYPYRRLPGYSVRSTMTVKQNNWNQEVRLRSANQDARLRWVVGGFWTRMEQNTLQADFNPRFPELIRTFRGLTIAQAFGPLARTDVPFDRLNSERTLDRQLSGFAQADLTLIDGVTLTAGVRKSKTKFNFAHDELGMAVSENHTTGAAQESPLTPKVGLSWQIDDRNMVYVSAAKGFRVGGANPPQNPIACARDFAILGITANPIPYKSDTVWNYEVGSKNNLLDGRVQIATSAFRIDWSNIQRSVSLPTCALAYIDNLGGARSEGFDLTAQALIARGLTLGLTAGYNKAVYKDTIRATSGAIIVEKGDTLGVSKWTTTLSGQYEFDLPADTRGYVRGDYQYIGKVDGTSTLNPRSSSFDANLAPVGARTISNVRAGVRTDALDISLFVDNLFDESELTNRSHNTRTSPLYFIMTEQPRTAGLTVVARY